MLRPLIPVHALSGETEDYLIDIACSATASSNSPVCPGATINLSSTFTGSGTPVSYTWTGHQSETEWFHRYINPTIRLSYNCRCRSLHCNYY